MNIESKIKENYPLKPLTTFKIGGPARYFLEITSLEELAEAVKWAQEKGIKILIFSGGSNILVNDRGVDGLVLKLENRNISLKGERVVAGAGANLAQVVRTATGQGLSGMEHLAGIPGSLGGAIRGNAGAYGQSIEAVVETVDVFNLEKNEAGLYSRNDCRFKYRTSIFKEDNKLLVWQTTLKLSPGDQGKISSAIESHIDYRAKTQPNLPSAGCVFKNFTIDEIRETNRDLAKRAEESGAVKGGKVGAGWLIDQMDLKGKKMGNTKISLEHANFIVNTGNATAEEVIMLISYIKQQVRDDFNVQLSEEIEYFGF